MGNNIKNYIGVLLALLGAVLLILAMLVPPMNDLMDYNAFTFGSYALIVVGIIAHVYINKKRPVE